MADRGGGVGEKRGRKGGRQRRGKHANEPEENKIKPNHNGQQKVSQRTEIKHSFLIATRCVLPSCVFYV